MEQKKQTVPPWDNTKHLEEVRECAQKGAKSITPRQEIIDDAASIVFFRYVNRNMSLSSDRQPVLNRPAWAYRSGRSEAIRLLNRDRKVVSLDTGGTLDSSESDQSDSFRDAICKSESPDHITARADAIEKIPQLLAIFEEKVVANLTPDDKRTYDAWYLDWKTEEELAAVLGIRPRSVRQRWHRLVTNIHKSFIATVQDWEGPAGEYGEILRTPAHFMGLLELLKIRNKKGPKHIAQFIESVSSTPIE